MTTHSEDVRLGALRRVREAPTLKSIESLSRRPRVSKGDRWEGASTIGGDPRWVTGNESWKPPGAESISLCRGTERCTHDNTIDVINREEGTVIRGWQLARTRGVLDAPRGGAETFAQGHNQAV